MYRINPKECNLVDPPIEASHALRTALQCGEAARPHVSQPERTFRVGFRI